MAEIGLSDKIIIEEVEKSVLSKYLYQLHVS